MSKIPQKSFFVNFNWRQKQKQRNLKMKKKIDNQKTHTLNCDNKPFTVRELKKVLDCFHDNDDAVVIRINNSNDNVADFFNVKQVFKCDNIFFSPMCNPNLKGVCLLDSYLILTLEMNKVDDDE